MSWKSEGSEGSSDKSRKPPAIPDISLIPRLGYSNGPRYWLESNGTSLNLVS